MSGLPAFVPTVSVDIPHFKGRAGECRNQMWTVPLSLTPGWMDWIYKALDTECLQRARSRSPQRRTTSVCSKARSCSSARTAAPYGFIPPLDLSLLHRLPPRCSLYDTPWDSLDLNHLLWLV